MKNQKKKNIIAILLSLVCTRKKAVSSSIFFSRSFAVVGSC